MNAALNYFIEANFCLLLFLGFYALWLKSETNFKFSRIFILASLVFSTLFPLVDLSSGAISEMLPSVANLMPSYFLPGVTVEDNHASGTLYQVFSAWNIIKWGYFIGVVIFSCLFIFRVISFFFVFRKYETIKLNNCHIALTNHNVPIGSFFNNIIIGNKNQYDGKEIQDILDHELVHVKQLHSLDIVLVNFIQILFWFSPFLRIYKKILIQLHEFEADSRAVKNSDLGGYCNLLARVALQPAGFYIANHFNKSLTLKRIIMMKTVKSKIKSWKLAVLALAFPAIFLFVACQDQVLDEVSTTADDPAALSQENVTEGTDNGAIYTVADEQPYPKGGIEAFYRYLGENIQYPAQARRMGLEGKVYVEFVVNEDGSINAAHAVLGIGGGCDEEAVRVISQSEKWVPGKMEGNPVKVKMVVPINFKLD